MLGGGVFVTQNKVLPGSYINFVTTGSATSPLGERGTVAIALELNKAPGTVIELTKEDFVTHAKDLLGYTYDAEELIALREIFCTANKVYIYDIGGDSKPTVEQICAGFEPYEFNILCAYTGTASDVEAYIAQMKTWRDEMGKKCQVVVYNQTAPNHEGVINVVSTVSDEEAPAYALVAWVAGAEAGCPINGSCTNQKYTGEYTVVTDKTQKELEACITAGQLAFHNVYGEVHVLEDINSLTEVTEDKGEDFKSNQTVRVLDQIANDIAKLFNTKYLGKIPNNASGRVSLWADIVAHHKALADINAIENFDSALVSVEQGATKKSIVVNDVVTVANAMAQLYMTVVVQ